MCAIAVLFYYDFYDILHSIPHSFLYRFLHLLRIETVSSFSTDHFLDDCLHYRRHGGSSFATALATFFATFAAGWGIAA